MKCSHCGKEIPSESKFCLACGYQVTVSTEGPIWEYKVESINLSVGQAKIIGGSDLLDKLNKWGAEGWELRTGFLANYEVARHFWGGIGTKSHSYLIVLRRQRRSPSA